METIKNPKELTLGEVIAMPLYKAELINLLKELDYAKQAFAYKHAHFVIDRMAKRHITDRLDEKGLLNAESIITLYPQVLAKVAKNLPAAERKAIISIGDMALHNTMVILEKQYENDSKENLEGKAD